MSRRPGLPIADEKPAPLPVALPQARVVLARPRRRRRALAFVADRPTRGRAAVIWWRRGAARRAAPVGS